MWFWQFNDAVFVIYLHIYLFITDSHVLLHPFPQEINFCKCKTTLPLSKRLPSKHYPFTHSHFCTASHRSPLHVVMLCWPLLQLSLLRYVWSGQEVEESLETSFAGIDSCPGFILVVVSEDAMVNWALCLSCTSYSDRGMLGRTTGDLRFDWSRKVISHTRLNDLTWVGQSPRLLGNFEKKWWSAESFILKCSMASERNGLGIIFQLLHCSVMGCGLVSAFV